MAAFIKGYEVSSTTESAIFSQPKSRCLIKPQGMKPRRVAKKLILYFELGRFKCCYSSQGGNIPIAQVIEYEQLHNYFYSLLITVLGGPFTRFQLSFLYTLVDHIKEHALTQKRVLLNSSNFICFYFLLKKLRVFCQI